jgi:hypothetical protein
MIYLLMHVEWAKFLKSRKSRMSEEGRRSTEGRNLGSIHLVGQM